MSLPDPLARADRDGALAEAYTRMELLRGAGGAAATFAVAWAVSRGPGSAVAAERHEEHASDIAIVNYALLLEELQADFYTETEAAGVLRGALAEQARVVGSHERAHVVALRRELGSHARPKPSYDFRGTTEDPDAFRRTAVAFEDLSVAAYATEAPRIVEREYLAAALAIHAVEARHAAWIRRLAGRLPAADAFDEPLPRGEVVRIVRSTGFIVDRAQTEGGGAPRFMG